MILDLVVSVLSEEAERAALLAKSTALKEKEVLEMKQVQLRAEREQLDFQTALLMPNKSL